MDEELKQLKLQKIKELNEIETKLFEFNKKENENNLLLLSIKDLKQIIEDKTLILQNKNNEYLEIIRVKKNLEMNLNKLEKEYLDKNKKIPGLELEISNNNQKNNELKDKLLKLKEQIQILKVKNEDIINKNKLYEIEINNTKEEFNIKQIELDSEIKILNEKILKLRDENFSRYNELQIKYKNVYKIPENTNNENIALFKSMEYDLSLIINNNITTFSSIVLRTSLYHEPYEMICSWSHSLLYCRNRGIHPNDSLKRKEYILNHLNPHIKSNLKRLLDSKISNSKVNLLIQNINGEELITYFKDSIYFKSFLEPFVKEDKMELLLINLLYFLGNDGKCKTPIFQTGTFELH